MKTEELPPVYQADLDGEAYAALLRDLTSLDGGLDVVVKHAPNVLVPEGATWTLDAARRALEAGEVRAIQVRYVHEATLWIDTILRVPGGFRLVRMQAPSAQPAPSAHG